ncbi:MAG TPA: DJ-1 family glyoxalase III [Polyangiaceae bacterium]|nr:DJ-1 family glyoxalase III [Polyangiaceae bacterium]
MASALVVLAEGFEEIEAVTIVDVLRRAGVAVTLAGLAEGPVRGAHDIIVAADTTLDAVANDPFDAVVLPGGGPGTRRLREDARVLALVRRFAAEGKLIAAICAAPTVLDAAGVLRDKTATCYPGSALPTARFVEDRVVEHENVVTSRGPGTAIDFALALVARLVSAEAAREHRERLLA